jgi:hypothetical protein
MVQRDPIRDFGDEHQVMRRASCVVILGLSSLMPLQAHAGAPKPSELPATSRPEPPKGRTLYGAGIFGVTFGIFNIGYGIPLTIEGPGDAFFSGAIPIAFGATFVALGAAGIHYGKRRKAVWAAWKRDPTAPPPLFVRVRPPKYTAWFVVGGTTMSFGLATMAMMIPPITDPVLNTPSFAPWVMSWGAVSTAAGIAMLSVGGVERRRARPRPEPRVEVTPVPWARREGIGLALVGRF